MTFDEWWEDFVAEHDEWKYADSAALRRAAFQAGAASRDSEVAELKLAMDTYFIERNSARDALKRAADARDQLRAQVNVLLGALTNLLKATPPGKADDAMTFTRKNSEYMTACSSARAAIAKVRKP